MLQCILILQTLSKENIGKKRFENEIHIRSILSKKSGGKKRKKKINHAKLYFSQIEDDQYMPEILPSVNVTFIDINPPPQKKKSDKLWKYETVYFSNGR